jgi:lysophospholipase L1-like esterase
VKVTAVGGTAKVYGSYWYLGNRTSGIQVHNGGHSGAGPLDHSTTRGTLEHIALVQPDLVVVPIGAAANNAPTVLGGGFDDGVADYSTNITALLEAIAVEAPLASIAHVAEHAFTGRSATWPPFAVASRALAAEGGWGFADCYAAIGYTGGDPYDLAIFDEVHLNGRGHRVMADTILNAVVGPTTRLDGAVLSAPSGDTADIWLASGTGTRARLASILGTVAWYLRRATDSAERAWSQTPASRGATAPTRSTPSSSASPLAC